MVKLDYTTLAMFVVKTLRNRHHSLSKVEFHQAIRDDYNLDYFFDEGNFTMFVFKTPEDRTQFFLTYYETIT